MRLSFSIVNVHTSVFDLPLETQGSTEEKKKLQMKKGAPFYLLIAPS